MKHLKKFIGLLLIAILLVTSVGTSVQAAKWITWPYGTYKGSTKKLKNERLEWYFATDAPDEYDQCILLYEKGYKKNGWDLLFKKTKTVNKYKSDIYLWPYDDNGDYNGQFYCTITVKSKSLILKWYDLKKNGKYKLYDTDKYKIQKRMNKNIG